MNKGPWVDLHTHTTASDGDLSPPELVEYACKLGLRAVAVTDHDTVEGVPDALMKGQAIGLEVVSGVELSVEAQPGGSFHLLGYDINVKDGELVETLSRLQRARSDRNDRIMERLDRLGKPVDPGVLLQCAGGGLIGRPHIAEALVKLGHAKTVDEAFQRYLKKGASAYVEKYRLGPREAIRIIRNAGGVPVLAHPYTLAFEAPLELEAYVAGLVEDAGLMGIEVLSPDCGVEQEEHYRYLARKYDLEMTGGTDFHGHIKPDIMLGWGKGNLRVPYAWAQGVLDRAMSVRKGFVLDNNDRTG